MKDGAPWLARAFSAGHEQRLSPSLGAMYSGHFPSAPASPAGVTCPTLRLGVTRLATVRPKSHEKTATVWRALAMGVTRNMRASTQKVGERKTHGPLVLFKRPKHGSEHAQPTNHRRPILLLPSYILSVSREVVLRSNERFAEKEIGNRRRECCRAMEFGN